MHSRKTFLSLTIFGVILFFISNRVDELRVYQGAQISVYVIAISSLILLTGYSGQISLGQGAFLGIGGYAATLSMNLWHFPVIVAFCFAVLSAALCGAILGSAAARLSGPYLAGTTLALAVGLPSIVNRFDVLGGEQGIDSNLGTPPVFLGSDFSIYKWYFWFTTLAALITIWLLHNILQSKYGRIWKAVRSHDVAAELTGIHIGRAKVLAFTLSAGISGLAGALMVAMLTVASPAVFPLALSFTLATGAVLSGVTTLGGVMIGAVTLVAIPEIANVVTTSLVLPENVTANLPGLLVSALLILTVLFVPNGPVEQLRRKRSLKGKPSHR